MGDEVPFTAVGLPRLVTCPRLLMAMRIGIAIRALGPQGQTAVQDHG